MSRSVQLPLSGNAELFVVTHKPQGDYDEIFTAMGEGIRAHEEFLGLPFPVNDIVLLVNDPAIWRAGGSGKKLGSGTAPYFFLNRLKYPNVKRHTYHELGHFYKIHAFNRWAWEGTADFLATNAEISVKSNGIESRMAFLDDRIDTGCDETIQESLIDWRRSGCDYYLGERFLWKVYLAVGEETVAAALKDMTQPRDEGRLSEEAIYAIFLEHTPPGQADDFRMIYRKFHGGPAGE